MENSTYELLLKNLKNKMAKENVESSNQQIDYYASRMASQQNAQQLKSKNLIDVDRENQQKNLIDIYQKQEQPQELQMTESQMDQGNWWENFWAKTNEILLTLGYAVMKPVEGIVDFGANAVGWVGEKMGNEQLAQNMKDFTARDLSKEMQNNKIAQVLMPSYSIVATQDLVNSAIKGKWDIGMDKSSIWRRSTDDKLEAPEWAVNTAEGVGQAVGYALISFATGGIGGAAGGAGASLGAKAASAVAQYAPIAISATGSATTQALQEGASYDDAVKYGILSGATEAVSEAFVGGAVNKILGGAGATVGGFGALKKMTSKGGAGASVLRNLIASANEEGAEEVFSSVLDPIWKSMTYKYSEDKNFFERYADEFNENGGFMGIAQDYLLGAASSLVLGGAETMGAVVKASDSASVKGLKRGLQNVKLSANIAEIAEIKNEIANEKLKLEFKNEATSTKLQQLESKLAKVQNVIETKFTDLFNNLDKYVEMERSNQLNGGQQSQLETMRAYKDVKGINTDTLALNKIFETSRYKVVQSEEIDKVNAKLQEQLDNNPNLTDEEYNRITAEISRNNAIKRKFESDEGFYGMEDPTTSSVYIRSKEGDRPRTLRDKFKTALHERLHIALTDGSVDKKTTFSKQIKDYMIKDIGLEEYNKLLEEQKELQKDIFAESTDFKKAQKQNNALTIEDALKSKKFDYWFEEEVSADYIFNLFNTPQEAIKVFDGIKGGSTLAGKLLNYIRSAFNGKKRPEGYKELIKTLQSISKETNKGIEKAYKNASKTVKKVEKELGNNKLELAKAQKKQGEITNQNVKTAQQSQNNEKTVQNGVAKPRDTFYNEAEERFYKSLDESHRKMYDEIDNNKYLGGIAKWKMFKHLDSETIDVIYRYLQARNGKGDYPTYDEIKNLKGIKYAEEYISKHPLLKASENMGLVNEVANEAYETITRDKTPVKADETPILFLATGLPGAGKSSTGINTLIKEGYVENDNDIFKEVNALKGYYNGGLGAGIVQDVVGEAQENIVTPRLFEERYNIAIPMVGKKEKAYGKWLKIAKEHGYKVVWGHVSATPELSMGSAFTRFMQHGRYVSIEYINGLLEDGKAKPDLVAEKIYKNKGEVEYNGEKYQIDEWQGNNRSIFEPSEGKRVQGQSSIEQDKVSREGQQPRGASRLSNEGEKLERELSLADVNNELENKDTRYSRKTVPTQTRVASTEVNLNNENSARVIKTNELRTVLTTLAEVEETEELDKVNEYLENMLDELETTDNVDKVYKKFTKDFTTLFNKILPQIKELQSFYDNFKIGEVIDTEMFNKTATLENLMGELNALILINDKEFIDKISSKAVKKTFEDTLKPILDQARVNIPNNVLKAINERLQEYTSSTNDLAGEELKAIAEVNEKDSVKELRQKALDKFDEVKKIYKKDKNVAANNYASKTKAGITSLLNQFKDFERSLNEYKQELINKGILKSIADKYITALQNNEFKYVYDVKTNLDNAYAVKYAPSDIEIEKKLEEIRQNRAKQDKTELGETVANSLTSALEGTKFVFDYNTEILDDIKSSSVARKDNLKSKLVNGMSIVHKVIVEGRETMKATRLTNFKETSTLRVSAEAYIDEIVDWLFRKNADVEEVTAMISTLKQQNKDKDSSLKQANKKLNELLQQNEKYRQEKEKYNADARVAEKAIKELEKQNQKGAEKYEKLVEELRYFQKRVEVLSKQINQNKKIYNEALEGYYKQQRELLKQSAKLEREKQREIKRTVKAWEIAAQEKANLKGKYKVSTGYINFLQEVGKVMSRNDNFVISNKRSIDILTSLMSNFDEEHKVVFTARDVKEGNYVSKNSTWETTMTKAEIALNYFWNQVMGNEIASPYIYEESWQSITEYIKEAYDYSDDDIRFINNTILNITTGEETNYSKEQAKNLNAHNQAMANQKAKLEKIIAKAYDKVQYEHTRYLAKKGELSLFKHAYQAKQRILAFKKRAEAYNYKFGRLSGMPEGYYEMVTKLHQELSQLSINQIANGEYLNALNEFYTAWKQIEKDIEKWNSDPNHEHSINIEMADELKQLIEFTLAETDVTNIEKEDIDRFAKCIVGIKGFLTEAKEHRTIVINGEVRALEDISLEGIKEQQKLNELTANKTRSGKERFGFASSWLNPQVIFDKLSGYQRDGIFNKIYDMLLEGQNKFAENYMTLAMPFAEFKNKYRKEYNSLKKIFEGTLEVDGQKFEDVTIGQVITLYETIKRMHAQKHFKTSGITFGNGKKIVFDYTADLNNKIDELFNNNTTVDYNSLTTEQIADVKKVLREGVNKRNVKDLEAVAKKLNEVLNLTEEWVKFTYDDVKTIEKELKGTITETLDSKVLKLQSDIEKALNLNEGSPYAEYIKIVDDFFMQARELKVEADKEIFGFTNVSDDYYFPIRVSQLDVNSNFGASKSIEEMGAREYAFNQELVSTMGSLLILDVDGIVERHMKNISMYNGFSPKIENFKRIYNWKQARGVTIKNTLSQRFGTDAGKIDKFFDTLIRDIQGASYGMSNTETTFNSIVNMFRGNAITTALGMNPKVWVSQLASLPAAMKYISLSNIIKGSKNILGNVKGLPEMPSLGKYRRFNSDIIRSETVTAKGEVNKVAEATTKPIQLFDSGAINSIWYASLLETQNKDGSWNIEKATEVFVKTVNETQPNYNALGRPEILRNNNPLLRMFVMYKTQSFQNFSNAYSAISRLVYKMRRGIPLDETIRDANGKIISYGDKDKAVRSLIALFLQGVLFTAIGYLFKRIINNDWGQDTGEHLAKDFGIQFINDNILGIMPVIDKLQIDLDQKFFLKLNINGWTDTYTDTLEKLIKWENMAPKDWVSIFSMFTGLPVNNTYKYAKSILQYILPEELVQKIDVGYRGKTVNKQLISNTTNGKLSLTYYNIYNKDINNSLNDSARKEMYRLYKAGNTSVILKSVPTTITSDGVEYSVIPEQFNQVYSKVGTQINNLVSSSNYAKLSDEEKSWQLQKLIDTYHSASKKAVTNEDFTKYESLAFYGFNFTSDLLSRYLYITNIEGTKRAKKSQLVQRYINTSRISIGEKYLLWWLSGYSLKDNQKAVLRRYLLQNGVTSSSLKEIVK